MANQTTPQTTEIAACATQLAHATDSQQLKECTKMSETDRPSSPSTSSSSSGSEKSSKKDARIGVFVKVREDGRVKQTEKIFKIIKEKDSEVDSDDETCESDDISRNCEIDKDTYKNVYKKSKKLVKSSLDNSYLRSTCLIAQN